MLRSLPFSIVVLAATLAPAAAHASAPAGPAIYWTDSALETITRSELDGTAVQTVVSSGLDFPEGVVLLADTGEMWWADGGLGAILRADLDGAVIDSVITGLSAPAGLALDVVHGKVYWSNVAVGTIHRANQDGTGSEVIVPAIGHVRNLALDVDGGKLYFSGEGNAKVQRANLDGTGVEDLALAPNPLGVALDLAGGKLYWAADGIHRANLDGSQPEVVLAVQASGVALDAVDGKIYWSALSSPYLRRANLDGSNVENLVVAGPSTPRALALLLPAATAAAVVSAGTDSGDFRLATPRPNPLRRSTVLAWRAEGPISLRVYDAGGRVVRSLVEGAGAGSVRDGFVRWDGTDGLGRAVRAGVYFVELRGRHQRAVKKAVVAR